MKDINIGQIRYFTLNFEGKKEQFSSLSSAHVKIGKLLERSPNGKYKLWAILDNKGKALVYQS